MAKKPAQTFVPTPKDEMTDEELAAASAATGETRDPSELPVAPAAEPKVVSTADAPPAKKKVHFVTSFNQAPLADVNRAAIAENNAQQAKIAEAHKTALVAVNKAFAGTGAPMSVIEAALVRK